MSIAHLVSIMTGIYNFIHNLTGKPQRHRLCGSPARLMTQTVLESLTQGEALLFKDGLDLCRKILYKLLVRIGFIKHGYKLFGYFVVISVGQHLLII